MSGPPKAFVDLHRLPEDARIDIIGTYALQHPSEKIAVPTDDEPNKPERYKKKLQTKFPQLIVEIIGPLTPGSILLRVSCPPQG